MKKLSRILLKEKANVLKKDEMKTLLGAGSYKCTCYYDNGVTVYTTITAPDFESAALLFHSLCPDSYVCVGF